MATAYDLAVQSWPYVKQVLSLAMRRYGDGKWNFTCTSDDGDCVTLTLFVDEPNAWRFYDEARPVIASASLHKLPIVVVVLSSTAAETPGVRTKNLRREATLGNLTSFVEQAA